MKVKSLIWTLLFFRENWEEQDAQFKQHMYESLESCKTKYHMQNNTSVMGSPKVISFISIEDLSPAGTYLYLVNIQYQDFDNVSQGIQEAGYLFMN